MSFELAIRTCGIIGIVASLVIVVADIFLLGRKDSFIRIPTKKRTVGFPFWRINVGNALGIGLIPLVAFGFVPLFFALRPAGLIAAWVGPGLLGYVFGVGSGGHSYYAYNGIVHRIQEGLPVNSPEARVLEAVSNDHKKLFNTVGFLTIGAYFIGSFAYSIIVLTMHTHFPMWMALINPCLITAIAYSSFRWAPSIIAGYMSPISMYIGVIPLQILALTYMWNIV
jgi:hypothetical protein